jgi:hypothetical protein
LIVTDESRLAGLPAHAKAAALSSALEKKKGTEEKPAWRFTLHQPSMEPFLVYLEDDALRQEMWAASAAVGGKDPHDNTELIRKILVLRAENAALRDQAAANPVPAPRPAYPGSQPPARHTYPSLNPSAGSAAQLRHGFASTREGRGGSRRSSRGLSLADAQEEPLQPPEPAGPARNVLSSTGGFNLAALSAFEFPPPPLPSSALAPPPPTLEELIGNGPMQLGSAPTRTIPRLVQPASTFKELDELSALLRKRAALKAEQRPSTATTRTGGAPG